MKTKKCFLTAVYIDKWSVQILHRNRTLLKFAHCINLIKGLRSTVTLKQKINFSIGRSLVHFAIYFYIVRIFPLTTHALGEKFCMVYSCLFTFFANKQLGIRLIYSKNILERKTFHESERLTASKLLWSSVWRCQKQDKSFALIWHATSNHNYW